MRTCYLCGRVSSKMANISLHKFPKNSKICKKWIVACGLQDTDDVSHLFICSLHFKLPKNLIVQENWKLPPGIVPNINVPNINVPNINTAVATSVITSVITSVTTSLTTSITTSVTTSITTSVTTSITTSVTTLSQARPSVIVLNHLNASSNVPTDTTNTSVLTNTSVQKKSTSSNVSDDINNDCDVRSLSKVSTSLSNSSSEEGSSPKKTRIFAEPRYISEINISDVSTPGRAERIISLIKRVDEKKRKQIKTLQDQNRKLSMRIAKLQESMSYFKEFY